MRFLRVFLLGGFWSCLLLITFLRNDNRLVSRFEEDVHEDEYSEEAGKPYDTLVLLQLVERSDRGGGNL